MAMHSNWNPCCMYRGMQKNARSVRSKYFVTDVLTAAHVKDGRVSKFQSIDMLVTHMFFETVVLMTKNT